MHQGKNFRYVVFNTKMGAGYSCIAFEWKKENGTITYSAGMSFCSPQDRFDKDRAREIAQGRQTLTARGRAVSNTVTVTDSGSKFVTEQEFNTLFVDMLKQAASKQLLPGWAAKAFKRGEYRFGLRPERVAAQVTG